MNWYRSGQLPGKSFEARELEGEINVEKVKHIPFLRVEVKDFGSGISDHDKQHLFPDHLI